MKKKKEEHLQRVALTLLFTALLFTLILLTIALQAVLTIYFSRNGHFAAPSGGPMAPDPAIFRIALIGIVVGILVSYIVGLMTLRPVNRIINALNRLASGDYKTRLHFSRRAERRHVVGELTGSFNRLAEELDKTEMLRSDFVNNFSHEFKTPIVSIAGFAGLLRRGDLDEETKAEYVAVIEEESRRLAGMATNVLNLTKLENQIILSDVTSFDLSELVRKCVLLLENKWTKKEITPVLDFDEYTVEGNEEQLTEVFLNLIDNAIKFSPAGGEVSVGITCLDGYVSVSVVNAGDPIPEDARERIFRKFYQADESHATEGNGIGLAIVRRVAELHGGEVTVASQDGKNVFTVILPEKQK